jgi:hypothetical protein
MIALAPFLLSPSAPGCAWIRRIFKLTNRINCRCARETRPGYTFSFHMRWYRIHFHFTTATAPTANNEQARLWFFVLCVCVYGHLGSPIKYLITRESTSNKLLVTTHTPAPHVPDADDVDMPLHLSPRALQLYLLQLQLSARSEI